MGFAARLFSIVAAFLILISFAKPSLAQGQPSIVNTPPANTLHNYTQRAMIEVMSAMICQLAGVDVINQNQPCLGIVGSSGKIGFVQSNGGAIGAMGSLVAGTFIIPVHSSDFFAQEMNNFGLAKKTYAQTPAACNGSTGGIGFCGLSPILSLFTLFRNMAYILFVFIFVLVGLAIMLRVRIDPRTVMTIQNQIPKLIIGLVMITFAYAIAGFLIDLMWIAVYFAVYTLSPSNQIQNVLIASTKTPLNFVGDIFQITATGFNGGGIGAIAGASADSVNGLIKDLFTSLLGRPNDCGIFNINCVVVDSFSSFLGWLGGVIAFLIFIVAIIVQLFKLWFALLKCFINVLLAVILAPFWILAGLLPRASPSVGWGGWIRNLAGNLAPFPAILFIFLIARTIISSLISSSATSFSPPLLGNINGVDNANKFGALIAFGFIIGAPSIVEQVKKAFNTGGVGAGLGGVSTGAAAVGAFAGAVGGRLYYRGRDSQGNVIEKGPLARVKQRVQRGTYNVPGNPYRIAKESSLGTRLGLSQAAKQAADIKKAAKAKVDQNEFNKNVEEEINKTNS